MMTCETVRELIPWYVTGRIDIETAREIERHLSGCADCQADFVEAAWIRRVVTSNAQAISPDERVRNRVERAAGMVDLARIDVGSFLVGLKLGISAGSSRYPVRGSLHVMGQDVRIVGRRKRRKEVRGVSKR